MLILEMVAKDMPMQIDSLFPYRLVQLARAVDVSMTSAHATRFGLCPDEWRVLSAVAQADPAPTREIARLTKLDKVAISRAASRLEERGLIARNEAREDRRIKILHMTDAGREMVAAATRIVREREAYLLEALSPEERACINSAIDKLARRASGMSEDRDAQRQVAGEHGKTRQAESLNC
ncbi:MAG: DNA-binding MarR family transcriptional regulator [Paracoccaceae bacterium]|jgi:DNA-binding MarR family transcriptional regulator